MVFQRCDYKKLAVRTVAGMTTPFRFAGSKRPVSVGYARGTWHGTQASHFSLPEEGL